MLAIISVLLFIGAPLFLLITYLFMKKSKRQTFGEQRIPLTSEETLQRIPPDVLQNLRLVVRYSPVQKRFGSSQSYVHLEEQLQYGNIPLTNWLKHDVVIQEGYQPSPDVLRRISLLKQYDLAKANPIAKPAVSA